MEKEGEHLLITFPIEETYLQQLRDNPLFASIAYHPPKFVQGTKHPEAHWNYEPPEVPDEAWGNATIQLTMFNLPPSAAKVPRLRFVQGMSAGVEHLLSDLTMLKREMKDLVVASASGVHSTTIAEYCLMELLAQRHRLSLLSSIQEGASWARGRYVPPGSLAGCSELRGQVLGIIGYGSIGREVARLASAFGMIIHVATSTGKKVSGRGYTVTGSGDVDGNIPTRWSKSTDGEAFESFLKELDVLVIACPSTPATEGKMNAKTLACLKSTAILVNVARGPIVDHDALIKALEGDSLGGAILDVTVPEPLPPKHPLWTTKNCIVTPHIAGAGELYSARCVDLVCLNVKRLREGKEVINAVDVLKGY